MHAFSTLLATPNPSPIWPPVKVHQKVHMQGLGVEIRFQRFPEFPCFPGGPTHPNPSPANFYPAKNWTYAVIMFTHVLKVACKNASF